MVSLSATEEAVLELALEDVGEIYSRFRLRSIEAERAMQASLRRYGQLSPVVVCEREGRFELIDGFKRLAAAREIEEIHRLQVRRIEVDDPSAKAAICALNHLAGPLRELEEAWIVHALVREDGLSQTEVAELLGHHKTWVCRRLALIERLCQEARADLQLGLLSPTTARELVRLPEGNQRELLSVIQRHDLTRDEVRQVVDSWLIAPNQAARDALLQQPRGAIGQDLAKDGIVYDPRLSSDGQRLYRAVRRLGEDITRVTNNLHFARRFDLTPLDMGVLKPDVERLSHKAHCLLETASDFLSSSPS